jgi:zinc transporter ZupT
MRPDLGDPLRRAAYRRELRAIAPVPRILGFTLILLGAIGLFYWQFREPWRSDIRLASWLLIAAGWILFIAVIVRRTRYHKTRMAED